MFFLQTQHGYISAQTLHRFSSHQKGHRPFTLRGFGKYIELQFAKPTQLGDDVPTPRMVGARYLADLQGDPAGV